MKNMTARYTGQQSTLTVSAKSGKKGIVVLVRVKSPDAKTQTGCRNVFLPGAENEEKAIVKFNELRAAATAKGWTESVRPLRNANDFVAIPTPTDVGKPVLIKKAKAV